MRKLVIITTITGLLLAVSSAQAKSPASLSLRRAKIELRLYGMSDGATSVSVSDCVRVDRALFNCRTTEYNVTTHWTDNGQAITGDLSYRAAVRRCRYGYLVTGWGLAPARLPL